MSARVFGPYAVSVTDGWAVAHGYARQPAIRMVTAGDRHGTHRGRAGGNAGLRSDDVPDVEFAALAIEHGLVLATHGHGFRRFSGVRMVDPLRDGG